ncbi:MAG TPA: cupin, partial [Actinomycetota bacterium]|nr:cupin [Actinomycetota bacterium]
TIGILTTSWGEVLRDVLKRAEDEPLLADRLPAGWHRDPEGFAAEARGRIDELAAWLGKADTEELAARRTRRFLSTRRPLLAGGLEAIVALESVDDETILRRRPGSVCEVRLDGDRLSVLLGDRELRMPARLEDAMRAVAGRESFRPADLATWLDPAGRLILARRLIREGLLLSAADGE